MGAAGIGQVDRKCGTSVFHGERGRAIALALLAGRSQRVGLAGIIESLTVSSASADRECACGPRLRRGLGRGEHQGDNENGYRAASRDNRQ
jgi:hypothetical protein